jgi:hypothetical protein
MAVTIQRASAIVIVLLAAAGCTTASAPPRITGDRSAHFTNMWSGDRHELAPVPVHHTFTLANEGKTPAMIISHRTRIDTVWRFIDSNDGRLPRVINPGQTIDIAMRGTMRKPGSVRFFTDLTLDSGEVVTLEMVVDG